MTVYSWTDRRNAPAPRAVMQRGECERQQCGQYSISISNGRIGLTLRFDNEAEFARFLATGQTEALEDGPGTREGGDEPVLAPAAQSTYRLY
jgi:hypothetical protein